MQIVNCFPCQCVGITDVLRSRSRMQMDHQVLDCVQAIAIFVQEGRIGVREEMKPAYNDIVHWAVMDYDGNLDPDKGLLIWGDIGTGKSTMLKIIREFCSLVRPHIEGNRYYFRIDNVIDVCAAYADESIYGGYRGIRQYIDSPRQAFDELGSETLPTGRYGNFENVMQYIFQSRYDNRYHQFTHATTNFTIDQIQEAYGERIYDRFKEMFNFVALRGKTFRINTQKNMEK